MPKEKKLWIVELTSKMVVYAEDEQHAECAALDSRDSADADVSYAREVRDIEEIKNLGDDMLSCLPHRDDCSGDEDEEEKTIQQLWAEQQVRVEERRAAKMTGELFPMLSDVED